MKNSQRPNWYRFHILALCTLLFCSTALLAQKPAVSTGSVYDAFTFATNNGVSSALVDSHGNYVFDSPDAGTVEVVYAGSSTATTIVSGLNGNKNVHVDNLGNLYVVSQYSSPSAQIIPYQNGAYNAAAAVDLSTPLSPIDGGYVQLTDAIPDNQGNVYIAEGYCSDDATCGGAGAFVIYKETTSGTNPVVFYGPLSSYNGAASLALDGYGNLSWTDDATGIYTINVNTVAQGFGNCTTSDNCDNQVSTSVTGGIAANAAGDLLLSLGQTTAQDIHIIPIVNGSLLGANYGLNPYEFISNGAFYGNNSMGTNAVTNQSYGGDGGYGYAGSLRIITYGGTQFGAAGSGGAASGTVTFAFQSSSSFANLVVGDQGTLGTGATGEFSTGTGYTACTPGTTYGSTPNNKTCQFFLYFTPSGVGLRSGGVSFTNGSGGYLATNHLAGVGLGSLIGTDGGVATTPVAGTTTIGTATMSSPNSLAVDGLGDVFVADTGNARIVELASGSSTPTVFTPGTATLTAPAGVAVDGAGYVYIADAHQVVTVDPAGKSTVVLSSTSSLNGTVVSSFGGIATDGLGNVFVSDTGNNRILRVSSTTSPAVVVSSSALFSSSALSSPLGLAVDGYDNLYIADSGNNRIVEISSSGTLSAFSTTYSTPTGVAVDAAGDLYVSDTTGTKVLYTNGFDLNLFPTGLSGAKGVAIDSVGDVFVANTGNNAVTELNTSSPTVNVGSVAVGSTTSAVTLPVYNIGNQPLTFTSAPTIDTGDTQFVISSTTCSTATPVAPGGVCFIGVTLTPAASGTVTGSITLAGSANQTINLTGTGTGSAGPLATTTTFTNSASPTAGNLLTFNVAVTAATGTPTGTIGFYYGTYELFSQNLTSNGTLSVQVPTAGLPPSTYLLTAKYLGTTGFAASTGNNTITLAQPATTTAFTITPSTVTIGNTATFQVTVSTADQTANGTVAFYFGNNLLFSQALASNGTINVTVPTAGLPASTYTLTAEFLGGSTYLPSQGSANVTLVMPAVKHAAVRKVLSKFDRK